MLKNHLIIMVIVPGNPEKALKPVIEPQHGDMYNSGLIKVTQRMRKLEN